MVMQAISFDPEDAVQGGLFDDINVRFLEVRVKWWDYNGTLQSGQEVLSLHAKMLDLDSQAELENSWSLGKPKNMEPSPDGKSLVCTVDGATAALVQNSKGLLFIGSLINCGFPKDQLKAGRIDCIDGLEAHIIRVADTTERKGIKKQDDPGKPKREEQVLIVDNILALPGAKKNAPPGAKTQGSGAAKGKGKAAPAAAAQPASQTPADGGVNVNEMAQQVLVSILAENPDGVQKKLLTVKALPHLKGQPGEVTKAVMGVLFQDAFLQECAGAGLISYAEGIVKMPQ